MNSNNYSPSAVSVDGYNTINPRTPYDLTIKKPIFALKKCALLTLLVCALSGVLYFQLVYKAQNNQQVDRIENSQIPADTLPNTDNLITETANLPSTDVKAKQASAATNEKLSYSEPADQLNDYSAGRWVNIEVAKGDNLSKIFSHLNLSTSDAIRIAKQEDLSRLSFLNIGHKLNIHIKPGNQFAGLTYHLNQLNRISVKKATNGEFLAELIEIEPIQRIRDISAPIQESLSITAANLGIPNRIISNLSRIFQWDIDFSRDIHTGDRFSVIYKENYLDDKIISTSEIIAAEFIINGVSLRAILHDDGQGKSNYYTPEGKSLRKAFMRNPVKNARVTSKFSNGRFHPILKKWRSHKGVDYGAARGTPIMATADGTIKTIGRKGAYGKVITINHGQSYSTLYAHMNGFKKNLKRGSKVIQGQIIGYVGSTGLSTGPHLHYEFRVNGQHQDPLSLDIERSLPLESSNMPFFLAQSKQWLQRLDKMRSQNVAALSFASDPSG